MVHPAFCLSYIPIPQSDLYLLLQTMRGAVDIVPREFVQELQQFESSEKTGLSETEIDTLKRRGYLTDLPVEQELEQARTILRLLAQNVQPLVELTFNCSGNIAGTTDLVDEIFVLANRIAGENGVVQTRVEISSARIDEQVMTRILENARTYHSSVTPQLTMNDFEALTPWLKSENFRHVLLVSDRENLSVAVEPVANNIFNFFKQQVHVAWRCNTTGMDEDQLAAVAAIIERVRQKYPAFTARLISDSLDQVTIENWTMVNETFLPFISADNDLVLSTLWSFVVAPNKVNYRPFFAPEVHKLNCELESKRVVYTSLSGEEVSGTLGDLRARLENAMATSPIDMEAVTSLIPGRVECKYALMCGCKNEDGPPACAAVYEQRLRQVLPLLLFNLKRNSQAAASHG